MATAYHVYSNSGVGDAINYSSPIAIVTTGTTWNTPTLLLGGNYWFGVRAFDTATGLEEENIDCATQIMLDKSGNDITNQPNPPIGLRAFGIQGGSIKVEWYHSIANRQRAPIGFHVYLGQEVLLDYTVAAATVPYSAGIMNTFSTTLTGLTDGVNYAIGVRAYNGAAEEQNGIIVTIEAKSVGPLPVVGLTATMIV